MTIRRSAGLVITAVVGFTLLTGCSVSGTPCDDAVNLKNELRVLLRDVPVTIEESEAQDGDYESIANGFRALNGDDAETEAFSGIADAIDEFAAVSKRLRDGESDARDEAEDIGNKLAVRVTQVSAICDDL